MLFLTREDVLEDLPGSEIADLLAIFRGFLEQRDRFHFHREVGLEDFLDRLADLEFVDGLEVGQPAQEQNPLRENVGVLHLVDRFVPFVIGKTADAPIGENAIVQPVLIDRGQFIGECLVEVLDDLLIALHATDSLLLHASAA